MKRFEVKSIHRSRLEITKLLVLLLALGGVDSNLHAKPAVKAKSEKSLGGKTTASCIANEIADSNGVCVPTVLPAGCILNGTVGKPGIYQYMLDTTWKVKTIPTLTQFMGANPKGTVSTGQPYWQYLTPGADGSGTTALMSAAAELNLELVASIRACDNSQNYLQNQLSNMPGYGVYNWTAYDWANSLFANSSQAGQQIIRSIMTALGGTAASAVDGACSFDADCDYGLICNCINGASKSVPPASGFCKVKNLPAGSQVGKCVAAACTVGGQVPPNFSKCCAGSINTNNAGDQVCVSNEGGTCKDTKTDCLQGLECNNGICQAGYCEGSQTAAQACSLLPGAICGEGTARCCTISSDKDIEQGGPCVASSQCCTSAEMNFDSGKQPVCDWLFNTCLTPNAGSGWSAEDAETVAGSGLGIILFAGLFFKVIKNRVTGKLMAQESKRQADVIENLQVRLAQADVAEITAKKAISRLQDAQLNGKNGKLDLQTGKFTYTLTAEEIAAAREASPGGSGAGGGTSPEAAEALEVAAHEETNPLLSAAGHDCG